MFRNKYGILEGFSLIVEYMNLPQQAGDGDSAKYGTAPHSRLIGFETRLFAAAKRWFSENTGEVRIDGDALIPNPHMR